MCKEGANKKPQNGAGFAGVWGIVVFLGVLVVNVIDRSRKSIGIDLDLKF